MLRRTDRGPGAGATAAEVEVEAAAEALGRLALWRFISKGSSSRETADRMGRWGL